MITLTIDGIEVKLEKAVTVLEAARSAGIKIPTLCYHDQLEKYGGCRLCLVEVEKMPRLQTACTLMVADGMIVRTETETIRNVRRGVLEFLLINHPLDCPYCDKAGECELQDLVEKYGPTTGRFRESKRKVPESLHDPVIVRNMERCVMCTRCVRMCEGVQGASAIAVIGRGGHSHIEPFEGGRFDCEYCGNCVAVCPVGAIMSRLHRHSYRPWQLGGEKETVCPYCGVGCTLVVQYRDDVIKRVVPRLGSAVNNGLLCSRGRFGYEFVGSKDRLTTPLIRRNGVLENATWEEAIKHVAERLVLIKADYGGNAIGGIGSTRCPNEDNYLFQKLLRVGLGTNNIDTAGRTGFAGAQAFIENIFGQGSTANIISGIANSDAVLVLGGDPTTVNPILGLQIRSAARKGGSVLTVGHVRGLKHCNPTELRPALFMDTTLLEAVVSALREKKGMTGAIPELEEKIKDINISGGDALKTSGVDPKAFSEFIERLAAATTPAIIVGKDLIQSGGGSYKLFLAASVNYLINGRIYLLSERANEQGAIDMGCTPDQLPGSRPLAPAEFRKKYETAWKSSIPEKPGMNLFQMLNAAKNGSLKALYVMGENPAFNIPDSKEVEEALKKLDFLVVQDIFLSETAKLADVVLPALSWAEKEGTFTNMERRIQRVRKAVDRNGMEDWRIIAEIAKNMSLEMNYSSSEDVFAEIAKVSPLHRDLTYADLDAGGQLYPYKGEPLRGKTEPIQARKAEMAASADKMYLRIERPLFHSGTLSRKAPALTNIYPEAAVRMSPETAARYGLVQNDIVRISNKKGFVEAPVAIEPGLESHVVVLSNNFEGKGAFRLAGNSLDPVTAAPALDAIDVTIEKVQERT